MLRIRTPNLRARPWTSLFFVVLGLTLAGIGGVWGWNTWTFVSTARPAIGKIEDFEKRTSRDGGRVRRRSAAGSGTDTSYAPIFKFRDEQGREHEVVSRIGGDKSSHTVGEEVPLLYNPQDPEDARIHSFKYLWLFPTVIGALGLAFLGGTLIAWMPRR